MRKGSTLNAASEVRIKIAEISCAVVGLTEDWIWADRERFEDFTGEGPPDLVLRVHAGRPDEHIQVGDLAYSVEGLRNVYLNSDTWAFEFHPYKGAEFPQRPPHQLLVFDRRMTAGDLYISSDTRAKKPTFSFAVFLLELFAIMLPLHGGIMVHASGISEGGRGIVFAGPSGAGKSTMAELWEGCAGTRVLNDDRIILRKQGRQWRAFPAPGIGEPGQGYWEGAPLEAVFLLSQADENIAERTRPSRGAGSLLAHVALPPYDATAMSAGLELLDDLVNEVPIYELGFLPDRTAVDFVKDLIRQGIARDRASG